MKRATKPPNRQSAGKELLRILASAFLLLLTFWSPSAEAQLVQGFALDQISFTAAHSGNVPCSEYGHVSFAVRQVPGRVQFVQVMAQMPLTAPAWIVRNLATAGSMPESSTTVDLTQMGVSRGTCINGSTIAYNVTVTDTPISAPPSFTPSLNTVVGQRTDNAEGVTPSAASPGRLAVGMPAPPFTFQSDPLAITLIEREGMGNVPQGVNECAPGATANSMHWLQASGGADLKEDTLAQSLQKLKSDMQPSGWTGNGTNYIQVPEGKLRFAQRAEHPLNLDIHYQADNGITGLGESVTVGFGTARRDGTGGPPTLDYLKQEMQKGQDVEVIVQWLNAAGNVAGAHALAVSGLAMNGNLTGIFTNDDAQQGQPGGERSSHWSKIETEGQYMRLGGFSRNRVVAVLAESPITFTLTFIPLEQANALAVFRINLISPMSASSPQGLGGIVAAPGDFTPVPGSPFPTGSRPAASATALGRFAYVVNFGSNNISAFRIDATTGALSLIPGSPFPTRTRPFSIATDRAGKFLYVGNSGSNNVSAYTIDRTTGVLTPVAGSPFSAGAGPSSVSVAPTGQFLYVTNAISNNVAVYRIDPTSGVLTQISGSPFSTGIFPNAVMADPLGRFVYVINQTAGNVSGYTVNTATGALTPVVGSPFAAGGGSSFVAVDPTGKFVYVANYTSNNVSAYTINASSGALTPTAGSPFPAGAGPFSVVVDPTGQFVYVSNFDGSTISGFTINPATGSLTPIAGFPFPAAFPTRISATTTAPPPSTIPNPVPSIALLGPSTTTAGGVLFPLTVFGNKFVVGSVVRWNGAARTTAFVSNTQLNAAITAADIAAAGTAQVTVLNPAPAGGTSNVSIFTVGASSAAVPLLPAGGTVNAAGYQTGVAVAPGGIATGFGSNFASQSQGASAVPLPTVLAGASLLFNGSVPAPLFFVAAGQVNFQVPWELLGLTRVWATITAGGVTSAPVAINLAPLAPGIFTINQQGTGQGAIQIANTIIFAAPEGSIPGAQARPVRRSEFLTIYCTALGDVSNRPPSGAAALGNPLSTTVATPSVTIGGMPATVSFSGLTPGFVGLYQVNVQVPADAPSGSAVELVLTIGGSIANKVTIAVE